MHSTILAVPSRLSGLRSSMLLAALLAGALWLAPLGFAQQEPAPPQAGDSGASATEANGEEANGEEANGEEANGEEANGEEADDGAANGAPVAPERPEGEGRITGRVEREDGTPWRARLELVRRPNGVDFAAETVSEPHSGAFSFDEVPYGSFILYASAPGYEMQHTEVRLDEETSEVEVAVTIPLPEGLLVRVRHPEGAPLGDEVSFEVRATVQPRPVAVPGGRRGIPHETLDEHGEALLAVSRRTREARVTVQTEFGAVFAEQRIELDPDPEALWFHEIEIPEPVEVHVNSVDMQWRDDREAPADVPPGVFLNAHGQIVAEPYFGYVAASPRGGHGEALSQPGVYRMFLPPGEFVLHVQSESFVDPRKEIELAPGSLLHSFELIPERGPDVRLRILCGESGEPVEGARLGMSRSDPQSVLAETQMRSNEDGWIVGGAFTRAVAENRNAWLYADGYEPRRVDWMDDSRREQNGWIDLTLTLEPLPEPPARPHGRLEGVLVHAGESEAAEAFQVTGIILVPRKRDGRLPNPGVQLDGLDGERTPFRIEELEPGSYDVVLYADGQFAYLTAEEEPVTIEANEKVRRTLQVTTAERTIRLVDEEGEALEAATAHFEGGRRLKSDSEGGLRVPVVLPRSRPDWLRFQLVEAETGERRWFQLALDPVEPGAEVPQHEPVELQWDEPDVGEADLTIEVVDAQTGEQLPATVNVARSTTGRLVRNIARGEAAAHTFRWLPAGEYAIFVQAEGYTLREYVAGTELGAIKVTGEDPVHLRIELERQDH